MLSRYVRVSSLTVADAVNKKTGDVMLTAARFAPQANLSDIAALHQRPWWYAFVQKVLNLEGVTETVRRRTRKGERIGGRLAEEISVPDPITGRMHKGKRTMAERRIYAGGQTRKIIGRVSRIITRRRRKGYKYFRALFQAASDVYGKWNKRDAFSGSLESFGFSGDQCKRASAARGMYGQVATPAYPTSITTIPLRTARKGDWPGGGRLSPAADLAAKSTIATAAVNKAMAYQVEDMAKYIGRKLGEGAAREGFKVAA